MRLYDIKATDQVFKKASECGLSPRIPQWRQGTVTLNTYDP